MQRQYQVFISSVALDLQEARQGLSQALARAGCFPARLLLSHAFDDDQFEHSKVLIERSDYYMILLTGSYGPTNPKTGRGLAEMEYDYAMRLGKPAIRLLHRDPLKAQSGLRADSCDTRRKALEKFRAKLLNAENIRYWSTTQELTAEALFGLQDIQVHKPSPGWVRSDQALDRDLELEVLKLREELNKRKKFEADGPSMATLMDAGLVTTALVLKKLQSPQRKGDGNLKISSVGDLLRDHLTDNTYIQVDQIPELASLAQVSETEMAALLFALNKDGVLATGIDGDYADSDELQKLLRMIPLIEVLES